MLRLELHKELKRSYTKQIYRQLRQKILEGELKPGERLPSTREMSEELKVARNTVLTAYDMLVSEGFAFSLPGSGLYVCGGAQKDLSERIGDHVFPTLSAEELPPDTVNFDSGLPALNLFPRDRWNRVMAQTFREAPDSALGYDNPQGRPEFRRVLAAYLKKTRGIDCHPDQILVTSGAKQGLTLAAKTLLRPDSEVWLEDPTNVNVRRIFSYHTRRIVPVPVDEEGIQPDAFPAGGVPALLFATPSHQFPMGGILSIQRRLQLTRYAKSAGCYILEDDYDSEYRYDGEPVHSLFELDPARVIYVGTFSKIMFPSLRLGYLVLPFPLVSACREWKRLGDHHSSSVHQLALMRFIESGELERHIRKTKRIYRRRRDHLLALLDEYFPGRVKVFGAAAGMHVVAEFEGASFTRETAERILAAGAHVIPVENHAIVPGRHASQVILGYAQLQPEEMERGIRILKSVIG